MKLKVLKPLPDDIRTIIKHSGYASHKPRDAKEESFVLRLGPDFYPRFHLYVHDEKDHLYLNLHIDQKQTSYEGTHMHGGEYEGPLVKKELIRLKDFIERL
ncbi:MAG: hypothetical protein ACD_15C00194G0006 [uncultured bacterium]|nr:MAG: hypothetical protein ACD_15C00194G0006 [uncultured bacterium]HBD04890.1 hypothetical protein [Candidatus Uhrbacteria bacterium]